MTRVQCPECSTINDPAPVDAGKVIECVECGAKLRVPAPPKPVSKPIPTVQRLAEPEPTIAGYRCPMCGSQRTPLTESRVSQIGLLLVLIMVVFVWCLPLCWI